MQVVSAAREFLLHCLYQRCSFILCSQVGSGDLFREAGTSFFLIGRVQLSRVIHRRCVCVTHLVIGRSAAPRLEKISNVDHTLSSQPTLAIVSRLSVTDAPRLVFISGDS